MLRRLGFRFIFVGLLLAFVGPARAANDPRLVWKSIETEHFRITYYVTEDDVASHVASLAESIYARLSPAVGWSPTERTEVLLVDQTDSANGSATAVPYNAVRLNVTAPDDMSPLGDVDDWYLELLTHEYTHILHTDHIEGIPRLINRILGKTFAPNQVEPHWLLEGLAVFEESARTSGGRLRSSMWNMWMRADILENNAATLDVFSNVPRRWPQGNIWYLYGSFFMKWIAETYGEQAIRTMIEDYSRQVIPYAINRSVRRATGLTFEELYPSWIASLQRSFRAQADAVTQRGIREGIRLTHTGNTYTRPRWIPANAWSEHSGDLCFYVDDLHRAAGIWALPLERTADGRIVGAKERDRDLVIRTNGAAGVSFMPDGTSIFNSNDVHNNLFLFGDLFELPAHAKSPTGLEGTRRRWTDGWRAIDPSVSPDGRSVAFITNHRGSTHLVVANIVPSVDGAGHALTAVRELAPGQPFDQAFTPRWSPDGRHVAYSAWTRGGYRDVRIVDTVDGSLVEVTHDRAVDGDPVFSADGRWLYFHSDRTGIMNIYAYELTTGHFHQVTNVVNGAYQPEPSPDGKWLAYIGYTHAGYDIFVMPVDESQWLEPLPYEEARPAPPVEPPLAKVHPKAYDPWPTLRPHAYSLQTTPGNFGQATILSAAGGDIAGMHSISASLVTEWEHPELEGSVSYGYGRLPFDFGISVFRQISPGTNYRLGDVNVPWIEETLGVQTAISYSLPRAFDGQSFSLSYSVARVDGNLPLPAAQLNPYATPGIPTRGILGTIHLGWSYSNAQGFLFGVGNEIGYSANASLDLADKALASDFEGFAATFNLSTYYSMPWLRNHSLALHVSGGMSGGDRGGRGPFYIGGFVDVPLVNVIQNYLVQGGIALRGYPVVAEVGSYFGLFDAEYRFPIAVVDRGPSTLPIFLNRVSGAAFVDYGSAFSDAATAEFKTGVGGELWFDMTLGYVLGFTFRAGYARGLASGGIDKTYFVGAVPF